MDPYHPDFNPALHLEDASAALSYVEPLPAPASQEERYIQQLIAENERTREAVLEDYPDFSQFLVEVTQRNKCSKLASELPELEKNPFALRSPVEEVLKAEQQRHVRDAAKADKEAGGGKEGEGGKGGGKGGAAGSGSRKVLDASVKLDLTKYQSLEGPDQFKQSSEQAWKAELQRMRVGDKQSSEEAWKAELQRMRVGDKQ